jgi:hypothetical protein
MFNILTGVMAASIGIISLTVLFDTMFDFGRRKSGRHASRH